MNTKLRTKRVRDFVATFRTTQANWERFAESCEMHGRSRGEVLRDLVDLFCRSSKMIKARTFERLRIEE